MKTAALILVLLAVYGLAARIDDAVAELDGYRLQDYIAAHARAVSISDLPETRPCQ